MYHRMITEEITRLANEYPVVTLTGPRQAGKTTLAKMAFPDRDYVSLEDPDIRDLAEKDPRAFFRLHNTDLIIDEVQRVPSLLSYIQTIVDNSQRMGQFILTGSHQLQLNESITQSLAGRTALLTLLPLSLFELQNEGIKLDIEQTIIRGFLPRVHWQSLEPTRFFRNYFQTYVERDVRLIANLKNLRQFEIFLRLCAGRVAGLLNVHSLANEVGVKSDTIKHWLSILEASYVIHLLKPYYENFGKRLVKTPKLYFTDVGLAAYLLGIESVQQIQRDPLRGHLFENMVVMELVKYRYNLGQDSNLYFYRDSNGNEVDVICKYGRKFIPIEIKSAETFNDEFLKNLRYFQNITGNTSTRAQLIYAGDLSPTLKDARILNYRDAYKSLVLENALDL